MDNIEQSVIKARTYAFFMLALSVDKTDPDWADVKIPVGNFPKGFEHCEALTLGQIVAILQVTIKKKLQDIVDGNTGGGDDGGGETPTNPHPPISCANAWSYFMFHTNADVYTWTASVNGGPWKPLADQLDLEYFYTPDIIGYGLLVRLPSSDAPATKVQLKVDKPVAMYFNAEQEIDDINQLNQSFVLFDSSDKIVDHTDPNNRQVNSTYLDDPDSPTDYCVMFTAVDFCLENK